MKDLHDYHSIQREKKCGNTKLSTSRELNICRETVSKYWNMDEETFIEKHQIVRKIDVLEKRTRDVMVCINKNRNASSHRIHEYLKQGGVRWSERTTARFVRQIRDKYGLYK